MSDPDAEPPFSFLVGGGEMARRIREFDWSRTALGPPDGWPQSLRSALSICLGCGFPIAIYWGRDLALVYNDAWSPIPAAKHPWALGHPAHEVWPEIWEDIAPLFAQVQSTGEAVRRSDQLLPMHRRGFTEECYFDFTFSPIHDESGHVAGIFNAAIETTARVLAERRARLLRDLAAGTLDAPTPAAVAHAAALAFEEHRNDLPFTLLYLVEADGTARLAAGSGLSDAAFARVPQSCDPRGAGTPFRFLEAGQRAEGEGLLLGKEGLAVFGEAVAGSPWPHAVERVVVHVLPRAGGEGPAGFFIAGVSPRLAWDEEYSGAVAQAARGVATALHRARAHAAERERAEKLAEIDRAKTAFFSNVSHEFRTPLTLLLGPLEEIVNTRNGHIFDESRELATVAHRNALRLLRLVNTLLDFSRMEAGRARAHFAPTDLAAFTAELASSFRSAMEKAGLRFTVECPPLANAFHIDREMWEKIVFNLLSNAFKFTLRGEVGVILRPVEGGAELTVRDTGQGIPAEAQPHLFERFYRVQGMQGRSHEGSGIGLALVNELVKLHGGTLRVESVPDQGSTFIVTLPARPDAAGSGPAERPAASQAAPFVTEAFRWLPGSDEMAGSAPVEAISSPSTGPGPQFHVLLADDNADMRDYIARLLRPHFEVTAVPDGESALEAIRGAKPDLVLSDIMMPRLDGLGLLHALRGDPATATLPVILLSARAGEEARVEGVEHLSLIHI
ncbi:MAG: response regulator [Prosthecobacter sp.]|uniref:hybrid sensor histidine kinase/response regulator n=1 Tax=Prosthecobacter sp. TaxID=1965333 RepID=UPI0019E5134E|nr:ATP-binding protein [Prosthecobacter sp.]MBE2283860.1 response regulator [Prosthecobacter sp.]